MFKKEKEEDDKEKKKMEKKIRKKAMKVKKELDKKKKEAERILDMDYVERRLSFERKRDEKRSAYRDGVIHEMQEEILADQKDTFTCKTCGQEIGLGNMQCPNCGALYCMYCGFKLPDGEEFTGKCPKCQGFQNVTPAKLVQTTIEDIPEEDRFWEALSECPKCGGAIQPDWDECPICGEKFKKKQAATGPKETPTIQSLKEKRKKELMERRRKNKKAEPKRGI